MGVEITIDWTLFSHPENPDMLKWRKKNGVHTRSEEMQCNGCHWWWLNISREYSGGKKRSSNKSRKICANSPFFQW